LSFAKQNSINPSWGVRNGAFCYKAKAQALT
jgi:hypothetical protein